MLYTFQFFIFIRPMEPSQTTVFERAVTIDHIVRCNTLRHFILGFARTKHNSHNNIRRDANNCVGLDDVRFGTWWSVRHEILRKHVQVFSVQYAANLIYFYLAMNSHYII